MLSCSHIRLYQDSFSNFRVFFYSHATLLLILRRSVAAAYLIPFTVERAVCVLASYPLSHSRSYPISRFSRLVPKLLTSFALFAGRRFYLTKRCSPLGKLRDMWDFFLLRGGCQLNSHLHFSTDSGVSTTLLPRLSMKERTWECFNPQPPPAPVIKKVNQIPIDSTNQCWRGWGEWVGGFGGWGKSVGIESQL